MCGQDLKCHKRLDESKLVFTLWLNISSKPFMGRVNLLVGPRHKTLLVWAPLVHHLGLVYY
jgi:hypothetical protein